jgi:AraC-like DNA-binding protein
LGYEDPPVPHWAAGQPSPRNCAAYATSTGKYERPRSPAALLQRWPGARAAQPPLRAAPHSLTNGHVMRLHRANALLDRGTLRPHTRQLNAICTQTKERLFAQNCRNLWPFNAPEGAQGGRSLAAVRVGTRLAEDSFTMSNAAPSTPHTEAAPQPKHRPYLETQSLAVLLADDDTTLVRLVGCLAADDVDALEAIIAAGEQWLRPNQRVLIDLSGLSLFDSRQFERVVQAWRTHAVQLRASLLDCVFVYPPNLMAIVTLLRGSATDASAWRISENLEDAGQQLGVDVAACLSRVHPAAKKAWERLGSPGLKLRLSDEVASYLTACPPETTLDDVALHLNTSRRTLQRSLQDEGVTFRDLRRRARMERSKFLLTETDMKLLAIALDVGFRKTAQLRRLFLEELGVGPSEWRRSMRLGNGYHRVVTESGFPPSGLQEAESA